LKKSGATTLKHGKTQPTLHYVLPITTTFCNITKHCIFHK